MFISSFKSALAVATVAASAAFTAVPAQAGNGGFSLYIGNGHSGGFYYGHGHRNHGYHGKKIRRHTGYGHRRCGPRRALNKAYRIGLGDPHVARVNHRKIVVRGHNYYGGPAKIVFSRHGGGCKIIKMRGIR